MAKAGPKQTVSRTLTGHVRTLVLKEIESVLKGKDEEYKRQLILRLSGSILPRLNEVSGEDGGPIKVQNISDEDFKRFIGVFTGG